jgi:hypothetical protein
MSGSRRARFVREWINVVCGLTISRDFECRNVISLAFEQVRSTWSSSFSNSRTHMPRRPTDPLRAGRATRPGGAHATPSLFAIPRP